MDNDVRLRKHIHKQRKRTIPAKCLRGLYSCSANDHGLIRVRETTLIYEVVAPMQRTKYEIGAVLVAWLRT